MRSVSLVPFGLAVAVFTVSCGGDSKPALRDATTDDLPNMVLQVEDVAGGSRTVEDLPDYYGGAVSTYAVAFDLTIDKPSGSRLFELGSLAALYKSGNDAVKYVRGPSEIPGGTSVVVEGLGEHAIAYISECQSDCASDYSPLIVIMFQQGNILSTISAQTNQEKAAVDEAIAYAQKQAQRVDAVLRTTK